MMAKVAVVIPAAGKGERFEGHENKVFAKLDGRPVLMRTIELFINREDVCQTILVVAASDLEQVKRQYGANLSFMGVQLVEGGPRRCDSVAAALAAIKPEVELVAVHDAVRPCTTQAMIDAVFAEAAKTAAAILAAPLHGTIKRVSETNLIEQTEDRTGLYEAQTPQVFRPDVLQAAYEQYNAESADTDEPLITDDAQLVELTGHAVSVVESDPSNLKITTREDLALANAILKSRPSRPTKAFGAFEEAQW